MIYPLYAWRDKYTGFAQPMVDMNDASAKRNFGVMLNNNPVQSSNPADFDFYKIGNYDSESGKIIGFDVPEFICNGVEVYNEK